MIPEHYRRGRAPAEGTPVALEYLRGYVDRFPNKQKATMKLLGCSEATAKRLLSRKKPYNARIRVEWAYLICAAVGKPVVHVLGTRGARLFSHAVLGWHRAKSRVEQIQMASDCAASIAVRALIHYGLKGHFSVTFLNGWVSEAVVFLSPVPERSIEGGASGYHRIVITSSQDGDGVRRMWVQHIDPETGGATDRELLEPKYLESLIHYVFTLTKDLTSDLVGEPLR